MRLRDLLTEENNNVIPFPQKGNKSSERMNTLQQDNTALAADETIEKPKPYRWMRITGRGRFADKDGTMRGEDIEPSLEIMWNNALVIIPPHIVNYILNMREDFSFKDVHSMKDRDIHVHKGHWKQEPILVFNIHAPNYPGSTNLVPYEDFEEKAQELMIRIKNMKYTKGY